MCGGCDAKEKRELLLEKLMDDYLDDKRAEAFNCWKDMQDLTALYTYYIQTLDADEIVEIICYIDDYDWRKDDCFNDFLRGIYNGD